VLTAVGLFPAAMMGLDIVRLLEGAADMTERTRREPFGGNPVLDYTATCHLLEQEHGLNIRVLSTWGSRLEAVGLWYDQLLGKRNREPRRSPSSTRATCTAGASSTRKERSTS